MPNVLLIWYFSIAWAASGNVLAALYLHVPIKRVHRLSPLRGIAVGTKVNNLVKAKN